MRVIPPRDLWLRLLLGNRDHESLQSMEQNKRSKDRARGDVLDTLTTLSLPRAHISRPNVPWFTNETCRSKVNAE